MFYRKQDAGGGLTVEGVEGGSRCADVAMTDVRIDYCVSPREQQDDALSHGGDKAVTPPLGQIFPKLVFSATRIVTNDAYILLHVRKKTQEAHQFVPEAPHSTSRTFTPPVTPTLFLRKLKVQTDEPSHGDGI